MTAELQRKIYDLLKEYVLPKVRYDNDLMNILSLIWNVYQQKATGEDFRYKVLGDEIEKHYIMNDDWVDDKLFIGILNIFDDGVKFNQFVEQVIVMVRSEDGFEKFKSELSTLLGEENLVLYEEQDNQGCLVFRIREKGHTAELPKGALKFYVCSSEVYNAVSFYERNVKWPEEHNCFVLTFNYAWNDYSYKTRYRLYYVQDGNATAIDEVKIMKRGTVDTSDELPSQFVALGEDFCSLGCSIMYYRTMKSLFGNEAYVVLSQLRDVAFYESIYKSFEDDGIFRTSLLRDNISERARREGRYYVYGRNMEEAYSFSYKYVLPYHGEDVEIEFKYKYDGQDFERIIGLIGENGVGKTSLIKKILESLIYNDNRNFTGLRPLFSSVLMISYSPFDHYPLATDDNKFFINYEYSGLMKDKEDMFTTKEQVEILSKNIERIYSRKYNFYKRWEHLVNKVIPIDKFDSIIEIGDPDKISIDKDKLFDLCDKASSGETMFLYSISAIMAKIRNDSLIIMDEPEQHLHPRAVTALMHSVYKILKMYDSYALISTHSPYVIRELVSPNVLIFKRFDDELAVKRIGIESFGEDVSVLSDVVFGNMSEEKRYERFIEDVVERNKYDYDASIAELQTGPNSLGLNAKLLIRSVINRRNETSQS